MLICTLCWEIWYPEEAIWLYGYPVCPDCGEWLDDYYWWDDDLEDDEDDPN